MKLLLIMIFLVFACLASTSASAAGYLKFDGINGEAMDNEHRGWINLDSYEWGMTRPIAPGQSRRRGSATAEYLTFTHKLDTSSLRLTEALASGRVIRLAELHLHEGPTTEKGNEPYLLYRLTNVSITAYHINWESDDRPTEEISINFEAIEAIYVAVDGTEVDWLWNFEEGR